MITLSRPDEVTIMLYVSNAYSPRMNPANNEVTVSFKVITPEEFVKRIQEASEWKSVIGHADTAVILTRKHNITFAYNRTSVSLNASDELLVAELPASVGRLPEGTTQLPEGSDFIYKSIRIVSAK